MNSCPKSFVVLEMLNLWAWLSLVIVYAAFLQWMCVCLRGERAQAAQGCPCSPAASDRLSRGFRDPIMHTLEITLQGEFLVHMSARAGLPNLYLQMCALEIPQQVDYQNVHTALPCPDSAHASECGGTLGHCSTGLDPWSPRSGKGPTVRDSHPSNIFKCH